MGQQLTLPSFEGKKPVGNEVRFGGTIPLPDAQTFHINDERIFVVRVSVQGVNHELKTKDQVLVRSHKAEISAAIALEVPNPNADMAEVVQLVVDKINAGELGPNVSASVG